MSRLNVELYGAEIDKVPKNTKKEARSSAFIRRVRTALMEANQKSNASKSVDGGCMQQCIETATGKKSCMMDVTLIFSESRLHYNLKHMAMLFRVISWGSTRVTLVLRTH